MPTQRYPSVVERYYTKFFERKEDTPSEDLCVLAHSNKVCLITISPDHKALKEGPIQSINYVVETGGKKVDDVHGKRKLQAIVLSPGTPLCEIISGNGTKYMIRSPMKGKLCELNDNILDDITLLQKMPQTNGYLAIVLHFNCDDKDLCNNLLTEEQYLNGEVIPSKGKKDADGVKLMETSDIPEEEMPKAVVEGDSELATVDPPKGNETGGKGEEIDTTQTDEKMDKTVDDNEEAKTRKRRGRRGKGGSNPSKKTCT